MAASIYPSLCSTSAWPLKMPSFKASRNLIVNVSSTSSWTHPSTRCTGHEKPERKKTTCLPSKRAKHWDRHAWKTFTWCLFTSVRSYKARAAPNLFKLRSAWNPNRKPKSHKILYSVAFAWGRDQWDESFIILIFSEYTVSHRSHVVTSEPLRHPDSHNHSATDVRLPQGGADFQLHLGAQSIAAGDCVSKIPPVQGVVGAQEGKVCDSWPISAHVLSHSLQGYQERRRNDRRIRR